MVAKLGRGTEVRSFRPPSVEFRHSWGLVMRLQRLQQGREFHPDCPEGNRMSDCRAPIELCRPPPLPKCWSSSPHTNPSRRDRPSRLLLSNQPYPAEWCKACRLELLLHPPKSGRRDRQAAP